MCRAELRDNRRGAAEVFVPAAPALRAILAAAGERAPATDADWARSTRARHQARADKLLTSMAQAAPGSDGLMHPNRLLAALREALPRDAVLVADGGDFLSFARVGLQASTYLDPGSLGCIGIGTPFGISAALACPGRTVVVATGDGSFGFNAMEIDTAARHRVPVLIVVANNGSWAIEVRDQQETHGKVVGTRLQFADHAAMARGFGLHAERVERVEDLAGAMAARAGRGGGRRPGAAGRAGHARGRVFGRQVGPGLGARPAGPGRLGTRPKRSGGASHEHRPLPPDLADLQARVRRFITDEIIPLEGDPRCGAHGPDESLRARADRNWRAGPSCCRRMPRTSTAAWASATSAAQWCSRKPATRCWARWR